MFSNEEINFDHHNYKTIHIEYNNMIVGTIHHPTFKKNTVIKQCHSIKIVKNHLKFVTNYHGESTTFFEKFGSNYPRSTESTFDVDLTCPYIKSIDIISELKR